MLPLIQSCGVCLYDLLNEARIARIQRFLHSIIRCICLDFDTRLDPAPTIDPPASCKPSLRKYGAFIRWLTLDNVDVLDLSNYCGSWLDLFKTCGRLADTDLCGKVPKDVRKAMEASEIGRTANCDTSYCHYCARDIQAELFDMVNDEYQEFQGASLEAFRREGKL